MRFEVITLFPDAFPGPLGLGLTGRALKEGRFSIHPIDPRDFTTDRHRTVDDTPYGGGPGMVMKVEPLCSALAEARRRGSGPAILLSPQGRPLTQADLARWASLQHVVLVCGRYEGFDDRFRGYIDDEVSLGDFVLTGGEYAAFAIIDGIARLLPGTLGNAASAPSDSFQDGLLEHPQYTRPAVFEGAPVPEILTQGDHGRIARWRRMQSVLRTHARRPELLEAVDLSDAERRALLQGAPPDPRPLGLAVEIRPNATSLEALARLARAYRLRGLALVAQDEATRLALAAWIHTQDPRPSADASGPSFEKPPPISVFENWVEVRAEAPIVGLVDPRRGDLAVVPPWALRDFTPRWLGLGPSLTSADIDGQIPGLRQAVEDRQLPPAVAVAVALDRIWSEG